MTTPAHPLARAARHGGLAAVAFIVIGAGLLAGAAWAYHAIIVRPLSWPQLEATVVSSRVVNPGNPSQHRPEIVFALDEGGVRRQVTTLPDWSSGSYDVVRAYVEAYPAGATVDVVVNPSNRDDVRYELGPTRANLVLPGALGLMGLIFVAVGGVTSLWPSPRHAADTTRTLRTAAVVFAIIGAVTGAGGVVALSLGTAFDWPEVDATVVAGSVVEVESNSRSHSRRAYDIQVAFVYEVDGRRVTSRTTTGASSWSRTAASRRLAAYPEGSRHLIRHRPDDPNVIRFDVSSAREYALPVALLAMGFVFLGFGALAWRLAPAPP